jgi:hypothetical protein
MKRFLSVALILAGSLAALPLLLAQTPATGDAVANGQKKTEDQKPSSAVPSQSSANPFPEDITTVPVMPSKDAPPPPEGSESGPEGYRTPLPGQDLDPVRSPDDPEPSAATSDSEGGFSSSLRGLESLLPRPEDDQDKKDKKPVKQPTKEEVAAKDVQIGNYYLDRKNWKGAFSRFESALVLDPENPDVFWGLAEANRHLGNLADARANYEKVAEFDPDSRHGKDAVKALKEPEIANGKNAPPPPPPTMKTN